MIKELNLDSGSVISGGKGIKEYAGVALDAVISHKGEIAVSIGCAALGVVGAPFLPLSVFGGLLFVACRRVSEVEEKTTEKVG